jgi:molecular chaperone HscB
MADIDTTLRRINEAPDHFALFGLPRQFGLDADRLLSALLDLTRQAHPDFAGSDPEAQLTAMEASAKVNEAHRILADPEKRANYLLSLLGGPAGEELKTLPKGFLEKMMMVREEMADAQASGDAGALAEFEGTAIAERRAILGRIESLFDALIPAPDAPSAGEQKGALRTELNALRYIERMLEQMHPESNPIM